MAEKHTRPCTANLEGDAKVFFVILNAFSCCLATSGNIVVLLTVYKTPSLRRISNFFICSLAMADLLVGLLINPLYIAIVTLRVWASDHPLYRAENYLWVQSQTATTFSLAAISIDRYIAVTKVFRYQEIVTGRKCAAMISSVWVFSFIFASTPLLIDPEDASKAWIAGEVITVGIPLLIMGYCYHNIFRAAKRLSRQVFIPVGDQHGTNSTRIREIAKNRKAALTIAIVIGLFVVLLSPCTIFSIIELCTTGHCQKLTVYRNLLWAIWLCFSSSVFNPWVYTIRSREFRRAFRKMCVPIRNRTGSTTQQS